MKIDEVIETPDGRVQFKGEFTPEQTTAMVRWFITSMIAAGAVTLMSENSSEGKTLN